MPLHDPNSIVAVVTITLHMAALIVAAIVGILTAAYVAHTQQEK